MHPVTVTADLVREIERLAERLRHSPPRGRKADRTFAVASRIAEATGAPAPLPWVGEHVIGDQLTVLAHELAGVAIDEETADGLLEKLRKL